MQDSGDGPPDGDAALERAKLLRKLQDSDGWACLAQDHRNLEENENASLTEGKSELMGPGWTARRHEGMRAWGGGLTL